MNLIFDILRNKFVRLLGVGLVFYFGLMADKTDENSLGYRLSSDNIKKNWQEANQQGRFIMSSISDVNQLAAGQVSAEEVKRKFAGYKQASIDENYTGLKSEDEAMGLGDEVKCNDEVDVSYEIYVKESGTLLDEIKNEKFFIGSNKHPVLEQKIAGMKKGGIRKINVPRHLRPSDIKLSSLLKFNETDLFYKVTLHNFTLSDTHFECLWALSK